MVHAHRNKYWDDNSDNWIGTDSAQDLSDWNSLQNELEDLLDQVHMHSHNVNLHNGNLPPPEAQMAARHGAASSSPQNPRTSFEPSHPQPNTHNSLHQDRHSQALLSVRRAMDRFNEPEEAYQMPAQSQRQLQNAIRQIRSSQRTNMPRDRQNGQPPFQNNAPHNTPSRRTGYRDPMPFQSRGHAPQDNSAPYQDNSAQLDGFGDALDAISARLGDFEHKFSGQQNSDVAVADMASQIEQLSGVVEHLANNIGERGQIKRLENQIAKMADALPSGTDLDFKSLNKRLDTLSGAFEKLRDLQAKQVELNIKSNKDGGYMDSIEIGVRNIYDRLDQIGLDKVDLEPIETCVRTVYDRIDTLEQTMAMPTPAIERLSREMADFTKSMRDEDSSNLSVDLIAQVGGLVSRIEQIETEGSSVGELKIDIAELQASVIEVVEPRFAALENKIGHLSGEIAQHTQSGELQDNSNVAALEKHIHALAQKLDKTSSDLNGLQQVFEQTSNTVEAPNINAIADIVAKRTSEAMQSMQTGPGVEQKALDQLEHRLSGLFADKEKPQNPQEFGHVRNSIDQVNQRLARLEQTLSAQAQDANSASEQASTAEAKPTPHMPQAPAQQVPHQVDPGARGQAPQENQPQSAPTRTGRVRPAPQRVRQAGLAESYTDANSQKDENWEPAQHLLPELRDNMPRPPAQDGPLKAPVFGGRATPNVKKVPIPASLRVDPNDLEITESDVHELDEPVPAKFSAQGKSNSLEAENNRIKLPQFNDQNVTPPPAPASDFAQGSTALRGGAKKAKTPATNKQMPSTPQGNQPSADEQGKPTPSSEKVNRSTFIEAARRAAQSKNTPVEEKASHSIIERAMARFQKKKVDAKEETALNPQTTRGSSGEGDANPTAHKYAQTTQQDDDTHDQLDDLTTVPESFLTRHRQPILLAATVIAVGFLTLNLINQRFSSAEPAGAVAQMDSAITSGAGMVSPDTTDPLASPVDGAPKESKVTPEGTSASPEVVGSIDTSPSAGSSGVRIIDPANTLDMPSPLNGPTSIRSASLNVGNTGMSSMGIEMPPEAIGPDLLRTAAANGDARAQFEVAAIFAEGRALSQDLASAAVWYERAAAQGFAPASYRLANMLENGVGTEKNLSSAHLWYQLAADAGNRMSMHNLASLLASGQLGEQQFDAAAHWFENAASLGLKDSQFNLGMLYARGLGVPQSLESSFKWFSIAANAGDEDAAKARDDIARSLDAQIVARLESEVLAWEPTAMNIRANFAPIGTWSADFDPGPEIEAREVIFKVQTALNGIGFDTGVPDGLIGPKTIEAITGFENQAGMVASGKVNPRLLAVLGSQPV